MEETIKKVLEEIRPYLNSDGGDVEFIKYEEDYVYIKLLGACHQCEFRNTTIKNGIYDTLKKEIPNLKGIVVVDF